MNRAVNFSCFVHGAAGVYRSLLIQYALMKDSNRENGANLSQACEPEGLSVVSYAGANYMRAVTSGSWCVAFLNHGDRFVSPAYMERHLETDEVFVLLSGAATLLIGAARRKVEMSPFKLYNVRKGTWHQIVTQPGTRCLIVENADTSGENSEKMSI